MTDITTNYLGFTLKSPIVASASPLCDSLDNMRQLEDHGIAAIVLPSLFEEQLDLESQAVDSDLSRGAESTPESLNYFPELGTYNLGIDGYLQLIWRAKQRVAVPVIASLNGVSPGGWVRYARLMEEAGADALELNIYAIATDPNESSAKVEGHYFQLLREVKDHVRIPVAVKLSHFFTAIANMGKKLDETGADALVLFNRFYQPDFNIESLEIEPSLTLSNSHELLLRLNWIAILYGHVRADLAVTGGVHTAPDVLKSMMAGANVAMMTSAILKNGIPHVKAVLRDLVQWMEDHEYESIRQMRGSMSLRSVPNPGAFSRGNYMRVLSSYSLRPDSAVR
ncbi:MAG: dihydroorotate dehydrogenase-like protein [Candidatus Acidiferrales bacterium]